MKIFYINLKNRPDRKKFIENQAKKNKIKIIRINAVNVKSKLIKKYTQDNLFDYLKPAAAACTLSHIRAWNEIAKQKNKFAVVLEDDVLLTKNFMRSINLIEKLIFNLNFDLIKIESSGIKTICLGRSIINSKQIEICKFYNSQLGAAGYIISASFIKKIINKKALYADAIDTLFFSPKSNFLNKYKIYQTVPALVIQSRIMANKNYGEVSISSIGMEDKTSNLKFMIKRIISYLLVPIKFIQVLIHKKSIPNDFFLIFSACYKFKTFFKGLIDSQGRRKVNFY